MKRAIFVLIALTTSFSSAEAQRGREARMTPILVRPPSPPPATDPTGVYVGNVYGTLIGFDGTNDYFLGEWRFALNSDACLDCDPHQFHFSFEYRGITYLRPDGVTTISETGSGRGVLNPSRGVIALALLAHNCSTINPGNERAPNTGFGIPGYYLGGHDGEKPGVRVEIQPAAMVGRISGRDCYNQIVSADVALNRQ